MEMIGIEVDREMLDESDSEDVAIEIGVTNKDSESDVRIGSAVDDMDDDDMTDEEITTSDRF